MVDWNSPEVLQICEFLFKQAILLCLGVYTWEFLLSFQYVDLKLFTGRLKFRWVFLPYIFGRYGLLIMLLCSSFLAHYPIKAPCRIFGKLFAVLGTMTIACASTNLLIRTATIWRENRIVFWLLIGAAVGHWSTTIVTGFISGAKAVPNQPSCRYDVKAVLLFYIYTIVHDCNILVLTIIGLHRSGVLRSHSQPIWVAVWRQGIGYFVLAFLANFPTLVLGPLRLNNVMTVLPSVSAETISVICSSRAVISLLNLRENDSRRPSEQFNSYRTRRCQDQDTRTAIPETRHVRDHSLTTNIPMTTMLYPTISFGDASPGKTGNRILEDV